MKKENKTFYGCTVLEKSLKEARQSNFRSLPDMFSILLHNQTIINEKIEKILNKLNI